ncbi:hypothetical protein CI610_03184 [invertebrate metagenome]|uniref:Uncharacterized protein n=1 Tax=invertebrate metagenome TaxID=1711999 RepID=A0A2H9T3T4_9ZZZZ
MIRYSQAIIVGVMSLKSWGDFKDIQIDPTIYEQGAIQFQARRSTRNEVVSIPEVSFHEWLYQWHEDDICAYINYPLEDAILRVEGTWTENKDFNYFVSYRLILSQKGGYLFENFERGVTKKLYSKKQEPMMDGNR